jgi:hypothetical protein
LLSRTPAEIAARILLLGSLSLSGTAQGGEFRAVPADTLKTWLRAGHPVAVVDIQPKGGFREHHFEGALPAAGSQELDRIAQRLSRSKGDVVVVSPRGGEDALSAARRLARRGVDRERIAVLESGMEGAVGPAAGCDCCRADAPSSGGKGR